MANGMRDAYRDAYDKIRKKFEAGVGATKTVDLETEFRGISVDHIWHDEFSDVHRHMADAVMYGQSASRLHRAPLPIEDQLAKFKDHELIMELLKRGYAAMKLPADGGPPEVLRGKD